MIVAWLIIWRRKLSLPTITYGTYRFIFILLSHIHLPLRSIKTIKSLKKEKLNYDANATFQLKLKMIHFKVRWVFLYNRTWGLGWGRKGDIKSLSTNPTKWSNTLKQLLRTNCLSVIDHSVGLVLKGLIKLTRFSLVLRSI